ncbi:MAG: pyruvate formate lyase 1-activating protein, partial [Candidatus Brocadiia bacterium]
VLVRLPIVPGCNDRPDHFDALARLAESLPDLLGFEVMPYHRLGAGKRRRLGLEPDQFCEIEPPDEKTTAGYVQALAGRNVPVTNEVR